MENDKAREIAKELLAPEIENLIQRMEEKYAETARKARLANQALVAELRASQDKIAVLRAELDEREGKLHAWELVLEAEDESSD